MSGKGAFLDKHASPTPDLTFLSRSSSGATADLCAHEQIGIKAIVEVQLEPIKRSGVTAVQIYINNTAPIWWPLPKWDSTQLHRKADCQKVSSLLTQLLQLAQLTGTSHAAYTGH